MSKNIRLIVIDLDGTVLNSEHKMTERVEKTLKAAQEKGIKIVIATGKTRLGAKDVIDRLGLDTPGIYNQGLTIYRGDGTISYQKTLKPEISRQAITFAEDRGYDMLAYSGTRLITRNLTTRIRELTINYHEPLPEEVGPLQNILDDTPINKIIFVRPGDPKRIKALRWQLEKQLDGQARLMHAMIDDMVELLPPAASKGSALKILLKELNISPEDVMVIGDGDNDIEMVSLAGLGVAVGNASQLLKDVADHIVATNDEDGVAEAVQRFVLDILEPKVPQEDTPDDGDGADKPVADVADETAVIGKGENE